MSEALQIIFSDFWHFAGTLLLIYVFSRWRPVNIDKSTGKQVHNYFADKE